MPTINDVATLAGASKSAVSRVINDQPGVGTAVREKVLAAIDELGYRPNRQARSLRTARTHVLGLLLPTLALPAMPEIVQGAAAAAHERGYLLTISDAHDDPELWKVYIDDLIARQIDGLLCYQFGATDDTLRPAQEAGVPMMLFHRSRPHPIAPSLVVDDERAINEAFRDLIDHGHVRMAMIAPEARSHRFDLLRQARAAAGLAPDSDWTRNARRAISVVRSSAEEDARASIELLIRHIEGDENAPRTLTSRSEYVRRDSVGPRPERS